MQPQAQTPDPEMEEKVSTRPADTAAGEESAQTEASARASTRAIVEIELNFNAFADNVPATQHAKRAATHFDPSIQDFADQALEVATLRAELKRLSRECDALRNTVQARDALVKLLREQLSALRPPVFLEPREQETQALIAEVSQSLASAAVLPGPQESRATEHTTRSAGESSVFDRRPDEHDGSSTVVLETGELGDSAATISNMPHLMGAHGALGSAPGRKLVPEGHEGQAIALNRDIITIGRTRQNDICIPSRAVSRDHARLLVGASSVTLFDMDSANGCFVNGEAIKRHKLRDGDVVRIGDRSYRFAEHRQRT